MALVNTITVWGEKSSRSAEQKTESSLELQHESTHERKLSLSLLVPPKARLELPWPVLQGSVCGIRSEGGSQCLRVCSLLNWRKAWTRPTGRARSAEVWTSHPAWHGTGFSCCVAMGKGKKHAKQTSRPLSTSSGVSMSPVDCVHCIIEPINGCGRSIAFSCCGEYDPNRTRLILWSELEWTITCAVALQVVNNASTNVPNTTINQPVN